MNPIERLATLARNNDWTAFGVADLIDLDWDRVHVKSMEGVIKQAIEEGDDIEWLEEMLSSYPN
jgi:hypothetical protein